jgi:anaerobic ribonucleoside-triphosphate reductase
MQKTKKNISSKPKKVVNVKKEIKVDKKENKNIKVNVKSITTRDGLINKFDLQKIRNAIFKAFTTTDEGNEESTDKVLEKVVFILNKRFNDKELPSIENIQDIVEESLMLLNYVETAKNYILYREQRRRIRESKIATDEAVDIIDEYLRDLD